ncbi:hypothetical protein ACOMD4_14850 [Streptomyces anulatus]|uniref:hypothetical protein n=1 Tax=Streptomyces anulatus TaxID=1892 RepID=UPI003B7D55C7
MGLMSWLRGGLGGAARTGDEPAPAPPSVSVADRGDRVDVSRLEPIQRVVSGQQLTVGPTEFEAALTTRQDTALGTPLGHLVSPDAPAGLVRGLGVGGADPAASPSSSVAAQRSVDMPVRGPVTHFGRAGGPEAVPGTVSALVPVPVPVQRLYGGETSAMTSSAGAESGPGGAEELPVRRLVGERPVVAEPASPVPSPDPPPDPAPGSVGVQRAAMPPAGERPRRAPGLGAPLPGLPPTAQRRAASGPEASGGEVPPSAPSVPGLSDDVRAGGADRPTAPLLGDDPLVGEVSRGRSDDLAGGAPASAGGASDSGGASDAGDAGGTSDAGGAGGAGGAGDAGGAGSFVQRSHGPPALSGPSPALPALPSPSAPADSGPVAPLLGDRPLAPRNVDVQRAAEPRSGPAGGAAPDPGGSASPPEGVPVRWTGAEDGGPLTGPGVSVGPAPPLSTPAGPPSASLQRRAAGGPPVPASVARSLPDSGSARRLPSAGAVAVAAGVAQRMADGSVVFGGAPVSGTSRPVVQRDSDVAEAVEEPPPPEPDPVTEPEDGAEPGPGTETETGSGAGAAPKDGKGAPAVTDELVRALYAPLSRLLKNDLRLERERAGHLINTRH